MIGRTISHYKILEKLGEGGMGVVYKAEDTKLRRIVALKFLPEHLRTPEVDQARFLQEARAASSLNHPHVCTIYGIEEVDGREFIEMEYVGGSTLRARLAGSPLGATEAVGYAIQIGEALQEAHSQGIVHRDIKAENIMVNEKNQVKVMDFGLAKLKGSMRLTRTSSTAGTLSYMAPEQLQGGDSDSRSDIFSFGVVLYEMLTGKVPFRGEHEAAMIYSILHEDPRPIEQFNKSVPPALMGIVKRALEKQPEERYQTMQEMVQDLSSLRGGSDAPPSASRAATRKPVFGMSRFVRPVVLIPALALIGAVVAGLYLFGLGDSTIDSIAVLPFENAGQNKDLEYMSDGITESLINSLSGVASLRVLPRSTVFQFKGQDAQAQKIGKELGVKAVLTGRVSSRAENLNVQVELIDIQKESQLWGEQYNRPMSDFLAVQQEIAGTISQKLRLRLSGAEQEHLLKQYTGNNEAYQLYLKGNYFIQKATPDGLARGFELMNQAITLDPNFALPYSGIALYYIMMTDFYLAPTIAMPEVKKAVDRALKADEQLVQARAMSGWYDLWYAWNWDGAKNQFRTAVGLNPNEYLSHFFYSWYLSAWGRFDESIAEGKRMVELQPLSPEETAMYGLMFYYAGRYDEAIAQSHKALDLDPNYPFGHLFLGFCDIQKGNFAKAVGAYKKAHELFNAPWSLARLGYAYARAGDRKDAMIVLDSLREQGKRMYVASDIVATIYVALGDHDRAFEYLQKGYEERAGWMIWLRVDPVWNPLRSDPRFAALLNKMGLSN
jgi:serine/threonine-protein kinase